jgi:hypothetical protein
MLANHFRLMFLRLDFRFPAGRVYPTDNDILVNTLESFRLRLKRQGADGCHLWVREKKPGAMNHHYHAVFLVPVPPAYVHPVDYGQWKQELLGKADSLWSKNLGLDSRIPNGLVDHCDRPTPEYPLGNGVVIDKGDSQWAWKAHQCYVWSIYLAKVWSKEPTLPDARSTGSSQLPELPTASAPTTAPQRMAEWIELGLQRHWPTPLTA